MGVASDLLGLRYGMGVGVGGLLGVPLSNIVLEVGVARLGFALLTGRIDEKGQQPARVR